MAPAPKRAERSVPSTRALTWLLILPERGTPEQTSMMETLCTALPILPQCRELVVSFKDIMARRASKELEGWLEKAKDTGLPSFVSFVRGIRMDLAAVEAAFSLPWSNGPVEGHVNRLKFIKRQGYGRASFELLRRRVLPLPNPT
ncbi:transposase [Armatimonas sp.]|uniref:transposase n=1 Tax=Armatimonas sp. TaxID=1872638 RepID=UPI00286B83D0|nr:transposase [Armatimonas sp.]